MIYSQRDPAWAGLTLGYGGDTIGNAGCFVTSFSNVLSKFGYGVDPNALNNSMKAKGLFVDGCLVATNAVPALMFGNIQFIAEQHWAGPADLSFFDDANDPNIAAIVMIDSSQAQAGLQTHFTMVAARSKNDLIINDSWDGQQKSITWYGADAATVVCAAYKYRRIVAPESEIAMPEPASNYNASLPAELVAKHIREYLGREPLDSELNGRRYGELYEKIMIESRQIVLRTQEQVVILSKAREADANDLQGKLAALRSELSQSDSSADQTELLTTLKQTLDALTRVDAQQAIILEKIANKETK